MALSGFLGAGETTLLNRAHIDSMITVVDAARLLEHFADDLDAGCTPR